MIAATEESDAVEGTTGGYNVESRDVSVAAAAVVGDGGTDDAPLGGEEPTRGGDPDTLGVGGVDPLRGGDEDPLRGGDPDPFGDGGRAVGTGFSPAARGDASTEGLLVNYECD